MMKIIFGSLHWSLGNFVRAKLKYLLNEPNLRPDPLDLIVSNLRTSHQEVQIKITYLRVQSDQVIVNQQYLAETRESAE